MQTEIIERTISSWTEDPDAAKGSPTVTARAEGSQAVLEAGSFTWHADLPPSLGGSNAAPSPTALLLSALAGCAVAFIRDTLAPQLGISVTDVAAVARCDTDARGLLGMDGADPALQNVQLEVTVSSPDDPQAAGKLADVWEQRCPVYLALAKPTNVAVQFQAG